MKKKKRDRFISIKGVEREKPNDFTRLSEALEKFKMEFYKALRIPQILEWISNRLK